MSISPSRKAKRRLDEVPTLELFDVSYCLCYMIALNGSQLIMPHHRMKVRLYLPSQADTCFRWSPAELLLIHIALRTFALITPLRHYSLMKAIDRTLTYVKLSEKPFKPADVIYHPPKFRNRLPFELQFSETTHFKGFVELSSLPRYLGRFGARKMV